jgi:hypothetical protein
MEVATLAGLLGIGYLVSKVKGTNNPNENVQNAQNTTGNVQSVAEGFIPAARGPDNDALTQMKKGGSAIGFNPELDMMYQYPNGQVYPSEPHPGPHGMPTEYATRQTHPAYNAEPQPIDSTVPMVEFASDGVEKTPNYIQGDYVVSQLSGQKIKSKDFRHNNMQPFFGGRMKQNIAPSSNTSILDTYTGNASLQMKKHEVENMFEASRAPYGNPYGMEDNTDFFQSRIVGPTNRAGEKPFEQVRVGAGLGEKFGAYGKGGFHQIEVNEIMKGAMKDTDELRTANNPKLSYKSVVVPGQHFIGTGSENPGEIRKYRPDRMYINENGERNFVTTGDVIKETVRPVQILNYTTRPETTTEYVGAATSQDFQESYVTGSYRMPMTQQYGGAGYRNANAEGFSSEGDFGKSSYENRPNERDVTSERQIGLNLVPADVGLVTTHYEDDARPTRRSETVGNIRITGNPQLYATNAPAVTVWDPNDVARTTVRETTIHAYRPGIASSASAPNRLKTYDPADIARPTQKAQLSSRGWYGPSMAASQDTMDKSFAYNMRTNPNKESIAKLRKPVAGNGNIAVFNGDIRQTTRKLDTDAINDRTPMVTRPTDLIPGVGDIGRMEFRVPLKLDVSRERNMYEIIDAVDNNPLQQSLKKNADKDERVITQYREQFERGKKSTR